MFKSGGALIADILQHRLYFHSLPLSILKVGESIANLPTLTDFNGIPSDTLWRTERVVESFANLRTLAGSWKIDRRIKDLIEMLNNPCTSWYRIKKLALWNLATLGCFGNLLSADESIEFESRIRPMLEQNCYGCHSQSEKSGNISLDSFSGEVRQSPELWYKVLRQLRAKSMPPLGESGPTDEQRTLAMSWIKSEVFRHDPKKPDPGSVMVRRLNRTEYRNTVRDLIGLEYDTNSNFPADDTGYGFDNIAEVLTISPLLLEKYISAAKEIVARAVPTVARVSQRRELLGGDFHKEVLNDGVENPDAASSAKDSPPKNAFGMKVAEPPKDDPLMLTLSYREHATGKLTTRIATAGQYKIEIQLKAAEQYVDNVFDYNRCKFQFKIDDHLLVEREFVRQGNEDISIKMDMDLDVGDRNLLFEVTPIAAEKPQVRFLRLIVKSVNLVGPLGDAHLVTPAHYGRFFPRPVPDTVAERKEYAKELLQQFATKAYRRPVDEDSVARLLRLAESVSEANGGTFESGIAQAITAILASPRFLFREEFAGDVTELGHAWLDDYAMATRLSYFLWSTMPDHELFQLADEGSLRANLDQQVDRMLNDPRSSAFFQNFVGQWLQSREVEGVAIDPFAVARRESGARVAPDPEVGRRFARRKELNDKAESDLTVAEKLEKVELNKPQNFRPGFNRGAFGPNFSNSVKRAMRAETEMLFQHILKNDLPLTQLIDSRYTYLNEELAKFYEIPNFEAIQGEKMRIVELPEGSLRGGILTQGTFLAVTSNPNRTSPVKRGLFILENIIGSPVAAPPPNVPSLEDAVEKKDGKKLSLRDTLALHRENSVCSSCHNKMDPLGLAFENFNALGRFREKEFGELVDVAGTLSSGEEYKNVNDLKQALVRNHKQEIYYCIAEKLMTYALGRGLDYRDNFALDDIVERIESSGGKARALLDGVVHSAQFLKKRSAEDVVPSALAK